MLSNHVNAPCFPILQNYNGKGNDDDGLWKSLRGYRERHQIASPSPWRQVICMFSPTSVHSVSSARHQTVNSAPCWPENASRWPCRFPFRTGQAGETNCSTTRCIENVAFAPTEPEDARQSLRDPTKQVTDIYKDALRTWMYQSLCPWVCIIADSRQSISHMLLPLYVGIAPNIGSPPGYAWTTRRARTSHQQTHETSADYKDVGWQL